MIWQTRSTGFADTERLGRLLGKVLKGGETIELRSDLGGGKTTFVRGLAGGAGSKDTVSSPTFTINKIYKLPGDKEIHHFDFYRLDKPGIIADQLQESLSDVKVITVVEWGDIIKGVLPEERITVKLDAIEIDPDERQISISYMEAKENIIRAVESAWQRVKP